MKLSCGASSCRMVTRVSGVQPLLQESVGALGEVVFGVDRQDAAGFG